MDFICRKFLKYQIVKEEPKEIVGTWEVIQVTSIMHFLLYIYSYLGGFVRLNGYFNKILCEYFILVFPNVLVMLYPNLLNPIFYSLLGFSSLIFLFKEKFNDEMIDIKFQKKKPYITTFRFTITILTCIAILAVDFQQFPRKWAKTEAFGTSLMDLGVGIVIASSGIVASERSFDTFSQAAKNSSIIAAIGILRLIVTKAINYRVSISEYGIHWNFFLTLAALQMCLYIMKVAIGTKFFGIGGIILSVIYEIILKAFDFQATIFGDDRSNLILQNKEGIFGLIGSLSLFMISFEVGKMILNVEKKSDLKGLIAKMISISILLWILLEALKEYLPPSRKLVNFTFVMWTLFISMTSIVGFMISDCLNIPGNYLIIPELVSDNQLLAFLVANMGTGIVNITIDTSRQSRCLAITILGIYSFVTIGCLVLYSRKLKVQIKTMKL